VARKAKFFPSNNSATKGSVIESDFRLLLLLIIHYCHLIAPFISQYSLNDILIVEGLFTLGIRYLCAAINKVAPVANSLL
jgi:hypothetical protein